MRLYPERPDLRLRHAAADLGLLAWLIVWLLVARLVRDAVLTLAEPGQAVARLGGQLADSMGSAARAAGRVPGVGDGLATPFRSLGDAGTSVRDAGAATSGAVTTLAAVLAAVLVVLPVGWLLVRWLPWRVRWSREAAAAGRLLGRGDGAAPELDVLAARALATAPLARLADLPPGTASAWRAGDPAAGRALAAVELARLGLRLPGIVEAPPPRSSRSA